MLIYTLSGWPQEALSGRHGGGGAFTSCRHRSSVMPSCHDTQLLRLGCGTLLLLAAWPAAPAFARTPYSDSINAEANYIAAVGYTALSVAEARTGQRRGRRHRDQELGRFRESHYDRKHIYEEEWRRKHPENGPSRPSTRRESGSGKPSRPIGHG